MRLFGNSKPNVKALAKREDVDGLIAAARFQELLPSRSGSAADLGVPVREEAILALGSLSPEAGNGTVTQALKDPADRVRTAAVRVLYAREDAGSLAEALGWLPADRGHARRLAVQAITELGRPDAACVLARALVRANGEEPVHDDGIDLLKTLLEADGPDEATTTEVIQELISALASSREVVADRAEELLADLAPDSVEAVIAELTGGKAAARAAAVLGRVRDSQAIEPLVDALGHRDARVRAEAAAALGELRDPSAVDALMLATRDSSHAVRAQAGWALDRLGAVAVMVGVSHLVRPMIHEAVSEAVKGIPAAAGEKPALPPGEHHEGNGHAEARQTDSLARFLDRMKPARGGGDGSRSA